MNKNTILRFRLPISTRDKFVDRTPAPLTSKVLRTFTEKIAAIDPRTVRNNIHWLITGNYTIVFPGDKS